MDDAFIVWCSLVYKGFGMGWFSDYREKESCGVNLFTCKAKKVAQPH